MEKAMSWKPLIDEYLYLLAIPINMETYEEQQREIDLARVIARLYNGNLQTKTLDSAIHAANVLRACRRDSGWGRHDG
jgi:hypothetical protein